MLTCQNQVTLKKMKVSWHRMEDLHKTMGSKIKRRRKSILEVDLLVLNLMKISK